MFWGVGLTHPKSATEERALGVENVCQLKVFQPGDFQVLSSSFQNPHISCLPALPWEEWGVGGGGGGLERSQPHLGQVCRPSRAGRTKWLHLGEGCG